MFFQANIIDKTEKNNYFRQVLFTGDKSQLVVMALQPGEDIGAETHRHVEQTLFFYSGNGKAVIDGEELAIKAGDVVVVKPGANHNFINTGSEVMKIYTIYSPANHIDGTIHKDKLAAQKDDADEAFGEAVR